MEKKRVLVVDDELGPRESLRMILKDRYDVTALSDGIKALEAFSQKDFDVVVLDIRMPMMHGLEALKEFKRVRPDTEVIMVTAYASVDTAADALRHGAMDYLIKPFDQIDVLAVVERGIASKMERVGARRDIGRLKIATEALSREVESARRNIEQHYAATVKQLLSSIDSRDGYCRGHSERVSRFSAFLAEKAGLPPDKILTLEQAALIHDVGYIGIDGALLKKSGNMTTGEFAEIRKHPSIGVQIVSSVTFLKEMEPVILRHHERYDGTGYPDGLKGEEIPMSARLVAVADAVDSMLSDRPYRGALTLDTVRGELIRGAGKQFDPEIVEMALSGGVLECYTGIFSY